MFIFGRQTARIKTLPVRINTTLFMCVSFDIYLYLPIKLNGTGRVGNNQFDIPLDYTLDCMHIRVRK